MSNSYFQFKQFRIDQDQCAMKVTTDACIQGAWTPVHPDVKSVLDIGAGTGLLSLMLAQRSADIAIDAIELDTEAAEQAERNFAASAWGGRLQLLRGDVCNFPFSRKYDLVISNPPFFNNSLTSIKEQKNMARHTAALSHQGLLKAIDDHLGVDGYAAVLLPSPEYQLWSQLLRQEGWNEFNKLAVRHTAQTEVKRVISLCSRKEKQPAQDNTLIIKDDAGNYTPEFTELLSPYYLYL